MTRAVFSVLVIAGGLAALVGFVEQVVSIVVGVKDVRGSRRENKPAEQQFWTLARLVGSVSLGVVHVAIVTTIFLVIRASWNSQRPPTDTQVYLASLRLVISLAVIASTSWLLEARRRVIRRPR